MSKEPIVVVYGNAGHGESRSFDFPEGTVVFIDQQMDFIPRDENVEVTGGTSLTDAMKKLFEDRPEFSDSDFGSRRRVLFVDEDRSGSMANEDIEAIHGEVLKLMDEPRGPHFTVVLEDEINNMIMPYHCTYFPRKEKDWQHNQKRGRMKPRRR